MSADLKPGYKQTEVGVIPEDWNPFMLSTLTSEIGDGIHTTPTYSPNGEYLFINGNNIRDGHIVVTDETKLVDYSEFKKHKKNLGDRTILLSINGTIGNLGLFAGEAVMLGKSAAYLNVKGEIGKKYIYHYLQTESVRRQFNDGLTGTTIRNLGLATIRNTQIALPPTKEEQEAIAEALSDTDALIESLEQLIAKKRHIKQGTMQELLTGKKRLPGLQVKHGYKQTEVGVIPDDWDSPELGVILKSMQLGGNYNNSERETNWPLIKMGNLGRGSIKLDKFEFIDSTQSPANRDRLEADDLLFNTRNTLELVGKIAIWRNELPDAYFNSNIARMKF